MEDKKDIVERLEKEAGILSVKCSCDTEVALQDSISCDDCRRKLLMWEAALEIEGLRNLIGTKKE